MNNNISKRLYYNIIILLCIIIIIYYFVKKSINYYFNYNKKKIAICFWGICRSTHLVIESINDNILTPLNEMNIEYDIYMHTYKLEDKSYDSSGNLLEINNDNWKLINPDYIIIENQSKIDHNININKYDNINNGWSHIKDNYKIAHNLIRALYSLNQVTSMWKNKKDTYEYILYIRPDVLIIDKIMPDFFHINNNQIILQNTNKYPISDRFAIGKPDTMLIYGERINKIDDYLINNEIHSETFLKYILDINNINIKEVNFDTKLIRANGNVSIY